MVAEVLSEFISPVQLLTLDTNSKTGEVSGRFRSGPMVFTYKIRGQRVSYSPLGGSKQEAKAQGAADRRSDAGYTPTATSFRELQQLPLAQRQDPVEHARRDSWVRRSVAYLAALWVTPEIRVDAYLASEVRMDAAAGKKQCSVGYACGATCIERRKECVAESANPERLKRLQEFATAGAGAGAKAAAAGLPPAKKVSSGANRNPKAAAIARRQMKTMEALEQEVTPQVIELAETLGGEMDGLQYRIKTEDSLARKIADEAKGKEGLFEMKSREMSDIVRYTMKFDSEKYVDGVEGALNALESRGMAVRVKNFWLPNQPYRGINVAVTAQNGETFELQFHTPESLETKHKTHPIYSQYREETDNGKRREQWDTMVPVQNRLRTPLTPFRGKARERMKERLGRIGTLKQFSFQTAEEAGLV